MMNPDDSGIVWESRKEIHGVGGIPDVARRGLGCSFTGRAIWGESTIALIYTFNH